MKRKSHLFIYSFTLFLVTISSLWAACVSWVLRTWANLKLEELIYELKAPLEGTGVGMVIKGVINCAIPVIVSLTLLIIGVRVIIKKKEKLISGFLWMCSFLSIIIITATCVVAWNRLELGKYRESMAQNSTYIEDNYVDPNEVQICFPEDKRNLIYIYLESMELSYADKTNGGAFDNNVIPELTALAIENEDFSGVENTLNGAYVPYGASWTMGAMFAHTSGLPLKISIDANAMDTQGAFFPGLSSLGDILESEGYSQTLMIGSDANFGGRSMYFKEHGKYNIKDYEYAVAEGIIASDYYVWWGYEDKRLFEAAKEELINLSAREEPFNFTLLTADTHFEDGYSCEACSTIFGGNQYSNVISCSSKLVSDFVQWIKEQDFYENTTIVLVGDHLTMDSDYCKDVDEKYERKVYTAFINSAVNTQRSERREYSVFDLFPTTLSAMGVKIEGDRLGLGTDLFSGMPTLIEINGFENQNKELQLRSLFMENVANLQENFGSATLEIMREDDESIGVKVYDITGIDEKIISVELELSEGKKDTQRYKFKLQPDNSYFVKVNIASLDRGFGKLKVFAISESRNRYQVASTTGNLMLCECHDIDTYLDELVNLDNCTVLIAVADEASTSLSTATKDQLKTLGVTIDLTDAYRKSFYAIISPNGVKEKIGDTVLEVRGELDGGGVYRVLSGGYDTGYSGCNIYINDDDYALNGRGLNFVVYDNVLKQVIDSSVFDTYLGPVGASISVNVAEKNKIEVEVSDISCVNMPDKIIIRYWKGKKPDVLNKIELEMEDGGRYYTSFAWPKSSVKQLYMAVYAVDVLGNEIRLTEWH